MKIVSFVLPVCGCALTIGDSVLTFLHDNLD